MTRIKPYRIRPLHDYLSVYAGPGIEYLVVATASERDNLTVIEERQDRYSDLWGRLGSGAGWIFLEYTEKID